MTYDRARSRGGQTPAASKRPRVTLDQLHTFIAVADAEHVGAAADALRLSQGSVSASIRRLEATLGLPLLHRVGRNVRLTDVGRAVRQLALRTLAEAAQVEQLTSGYSAFETGEVRVAAGRVTGALLLSEWLSPFVRDYPQIDLRIQLAEVRDLMSMLHDGSADAIILGSRVRDPGIEACVLQTTEMVLVVASHHPLAAGRRVSAELQKHRYLAHEAGSATESLAARLVGHALGAPSIELEEGALHAALLAGIGFAAMPRAGVQREIDDGRLTVLTHPGRPVRQAFTAARRRGLQTPAAEALWRSLVASAETRKRVR
ncbi:MAG TPA: LysR family transcriptional regulator [Candidatus Dormibacteraeota bacterium]